jgi:hypothetical protein
MDRLANLENGLTVNSLRQIYYAYMNSTLDYGSPVWWKPSRLIALLEPIQSKAVRRILGVFRTALALPIALEAGLSPLAVRLKRLSVLYGLRVKDLLGAHLVSKAIEETTLP